MEPKKSSASGKLTNVPILKQKTADAVVAKMELNGKPDSDKIVVDAPEGLVKPQWLGAIDERKVKETQQQEVSTIDESDKFVDYKDRQKFLGNADREKDQLDSEIESAAPGLIIRKPKEAERREANGNEAPDRLTSSSAGAGFLAEDAVALLLKHKRGYHAEDEERDNQSQQISGAVQPRKEKKRPKKVFGPDKPSFLNNPDYESWVPPEGQSGDGRSSLNDRYGY